VSEVSPPTLETERLLLRPFTEDDAEALHEAVYSNADVMRYMPGGIPRTLSQTQNVVDFFINHWELNGYGAWAVIQKSDQRFIGQCGLGFVSELQDVEVLYALAKDTWGHGLATEAAHASLRYGFSELQPGKIIALAAKENKASRRVMEKLGMTYRREVKLWKMKLAQYVLPRVEFYAGDVVYAIHE
jgi:ribosomal-protein-alanine N-acetyltransferase